jgi:hypothetical protein
MPNIRILNWNIEQLSAAKTGIGGLATNMGKVIATAHNPPGIAPVGADIAIILEVSGATAVGAMTAVSAAANVASIALGGAATNYTGWLLSYATGGEYYGVLIKNLNVVRPVIVAGGPDGSGNIGAGNDPDDPADPNAFLTNLNRNQFTTWPNTFAAMPNAYPVPLPAARPRLPLSDLYARNAPVGRKRKRFAGQRLNQGGYALGRGFRMPCLMLFEILAAAGLNSLVPVLACHHGAVRGGANPLSRDQTRDYRATHIAQKFRNPPALLLPRDSYIVLNGAATRIQEFIVTGDFNIDFAEQHPPLAANALRTGNRNALAALTPTTANGGSAAPAAAPGPAGPVPVVIPFPAPFDEGPIANPANLVLMNQALKAANTSSGTILRHYPVIAAPNTRALRGANFDNFFFGGTRLSATFQTLNLAAGDACFVHDVPAQIVQGAAGNATLNVSAEFLHYLLAGTHNAIFALNLGAIPLGPLTRNNRLIGARFISDHLPILIQFNLP